MSVLYIITLFVFGILFGSFFNVVGLRLPKKQTFVKGRSYCPHCNKQLTWFELIPVLSYLMQSGKCRKCGETISIVYPTMEFATGFLFVFSYLKLGASIELLIALSLISMLIIVFITDLAYMLIPNKILLFFFPIFVILRIIKPLNPWWTSITGAAVGFGLIAIIIIVSRGGMGAGDMKLFGVLGIVLGLKKVLLAFFLACVIGTFFGLIQMALKKIERKQHIPFGPYIVMATLITYFYGNSLLSWYGGLF